MRDAWSALCPAFVHGPAVVADRCWWGWIWCGDADSMMRCEMDGGPCVVIIGFMFGWRDA